MAIDGRLLTVIKSINELGICSVLELHRATGISRPAVHRMVECLCNHGYTERVSGGSSIRLTSQVLELSQGYRAENKLAEKAGPILVRLQQQVRWPHSLATPRNDTMVIQETTRSQNPFVFDNGRTGLCVPMMSSAMGCAYLSAADPDLAAATLERASIAGSESSEELMAARRRIVEARKKGAALRTGGMPERTSSVAVPLVIAGVAVGAISTTFPTRAVSAGEIYGQLVPALHQACRAVAATYEH